MTFMYITLDFCTKRILHYLTKFFRNNTKALEINNAEVEIT